MKIACLLPAFLLALPIEARGRSFVLSRSSSLPTSTSNLLLQKQLDVRGGAGPLDASTVGKAFTGAYLAQGTLMTLAPKRSAAMYGVDEGFTKQYVAELCGAEVLAQAIVGISMIFRNTEFTEAYGYANLARAIVVLRKYLNEEHKALSSPNASLLVAVTAYAVSAYGSLTNQGWVDFYNQVLAASGILVGSVGLILPDTLADLLGMSSAVSKVLSRGKSAVSASPNTALTYLLKYFSSWTMGSGILALCLMNSNSKFTTVESLAYASIPVLGLLLSSTFITKEIGAMGVKPEPHLFWVIFYCVLIASSLL